MSFEIASPLSRKWDAETMDLPIVEHAEQKRPSLLSRESPTEKKALTSAFA
jgi:hypothetical protein